MEILVITSAVALILLGMRMLRKGLDRLFGGGLVAWMRRVTSNPIKAFGAGVAAGAVAPSSTSMAVLAVRMLDQASLPAGRMFGVLLGANVGITMAVQLMAFRIDQAAYPLITLGAAGFLFATRRVLRGVGQVLFAFGLILLAMRLIGEGSATLAARPDVVALFAALSGFTMLVMIGTLGLAVVLQSSTAAIALGLGLAQAGLLPAPALVPWVLGTNLGMAVTIAIAGWHSVEGRRLALANLLWRAVFGALVLGVFMIFPLSPAGISAAPERLAADLHTGFNLLAGLLALPIAGRLVSLSGWFLNSRPGDDGPARRHFSRTLLQSPALALQHAAREMFPMLDSLRFMTKTTWSIGMDLRPERFTIVDKVHADVLAARDELQHYLAKIEDDALDERDSLWKHHLFDFSQEIAAASLLVKRDFTDAALRFTSARPELPQAALEELIAIHQITLERIVLAAGLLMTRDGTAAQHVIEGKAALAMRIRRCRGFYQRRAARDPAAAAWLPHLADFLECFRRLNSHITTLAYAIVPGSEEMPEVAGAPVMQVSE